MPNLQSLPVEIIDLICNQIGSSSREPQSSLAALSRSCKILHNSAQPFLYRHLEAEKKFSRLFQTLFQRKDLAIYTKSIVLGEWDYRDNTKILPEDRKAVKQLSQRLFDEAPESKKEKVPAWHLSHPFENDEFADGEFYNDEYRPIFHTLVLLLVPNIEQLVLRTYYDGHYQSYAPNSLPFLTEFEYIHGDTELGIRLSDVSGILAAAPNLRILKGHMVNQICGAPHLEALRELHLECSTITTEDLEAAVECFPLLEAFSLESGGASVGDGPEPTPFEIWEVILRWKNTLRSLDLHIYDAFYVDDLSADDLMKSLKPMQALESIKVDSSTFFHENLTSTDGNLLIDFLPSSTKSFTLQLASEPIYNDILKLARVAKDQLPKLEDVKIFTLNRNLDDSNMLNQAFVTSSSDA